jgi:hypothetical protein
MPFQERKDERSAPKRDALDEHYGKIGISAVAAAARYSSERKSGAGDNPSAEAAK